MVISSVWRGDAGMPYTDIVVDGGLCGVDRGISTLNSASYAEATCIKYLSPGPHSITVNADGMQGMRWSYEMLGI